MSSDFRRIYPNKERILLDGGKSSKFPPTVIPDNESPDCQNVVFQNGAVETRQGVLKLNTAAIGTFVGDGLYTRRGMTGAETMIAFAGGSAWYLAGTSFSVIPSGTSVFTAGFRVGAAQVENHIFMGNGGVVPYKYNGTNFTKHGIYAPTTTSTVASQTTGGLTGDYRYKVTAVNSQSVESDVGPVSVTFAATAALLRVSSIPTFAASFGVAARRLYRTVTSGAVFKRVTEIADNTTTTFDDNVADSALGANAPTDNGVPPKYSFICYHQNRLFMNDFDNPNFLWFTNLGDPYTVASTNFLQVGDSSTDLIKGLGVYENAVFVYCERSTWIVYMPDTDETNWQVQKCKTTFGTRSPHGIVGYKNKQLFPAVENGKFVGLATMVGATNETSTSLLSVSTAGSLLTSDRIEPDMFSVQETYLGNISSIVYKNKAYISLTYDSGNTLNNRIYVMDFSLDNVRKNQKEAWVPWTGLSAAQFTTYDGNLYFISSTATGFVYKMEAGIYNDDGSAIDSYFWTKELCGFEDEINFNKDFRSLNMLIDTSGAYFMNLSYRVDSDKGSGDTVQVDLNPHGSLWGTMRWGVDTWGGGSYQREHKQYLAQSRGKRIQFKFSNQNKVDQKFKVHGINFAYNLKGYR